MNGKSGNGWFGRWVVIHGLCAANVASSQASMTAQMGRRMIGI